MEDLRLLGLTGFEPYANAAKKMAKHLKKEHSDKGGSNARAAKVIEARARIVLAYKRGDLPMVVPPSIPSRSEPPLKPRRPRDPLKPVRADRSPVRRTHGAPYSRISDRRSRSPRPHLRERSKTTTTMGHSLHGKTTKTTKAKRGRRDGPVPMDIDRHPLF